MTDRSIGDPRRIAVFRALFLGDMILAVPAFRALRRRFPHAEITYIGLPWAAVLTRHFTSYIDRFIEFPGYPGIDEVPVDPARTAAFLAEQRAYRYDLALQMHGSGETSNPFVLALGAAITVGYYRHQSSDLTLGAPYPEGQPEVWRNLALTRLAGCTNLDPHLEFPILPEDRTEIAECIRPARQEGRLFIGLHPGASVAPRRWPPEYFAAVGDELSRRCGAQVILTGGPNEDDLAAAVAHHMRCPAIIAAGRTSLGGLAALLAELDLFISNDTGPAHLAQAIGTPSIIIFGPTDYPRWAPLHPEHHIPVRLPPDISPLDPHCLRHITPARVLAAAERLLSIGVAA